MIFVNGARIAERPQRRRMASVTVLKDTLLLIYFFITMCVKSPEH